MWYCACDRAAFGVVDGLLSLVDVRGRGSSCEAQPGQTLRSITRQTGQEQSPLLGASRLCYEEDTEREESSSLQGIDIG